MTVRTAYRAGAFYEADPEACREHAQRLIDEAEIPADLPSTLRGGIVPHAGWVYSGSLAAMVLKALSRAGGLGTVVLFGADHTGSAREGELWPDGAWRTPLGDVPVDADLAAELIHHADVLRANPQVHQTEHSLEVQAPLIRLLSEEAKILPIATPATPLAVQIGSSVGRYLKENRPDVRVVGSTDLTHHGGHFPAPGGRGEVGEEWTRKNDRRMIDLMEKMKPDEAISEAHQRMNACGPGAIAATIAACRELGATRGILLDYTNSYRIVHEMHPGHPDDTTVGYAGVVFA